MNEFLKFDDDHAREAETQYQSPEVIQQRREIRSLLNLKPGESLLDIGCGPGILTYEMSEEVGPSGKINGLDISATMLDLATNRCATRDWVSLTPGRAEELPFPECSFDAVVAVQVYEYVEDIETALKEAFRVLKQGGRIVILDTDWDSLVWNVHDRARLRTILDLWDEHLADPRLPEKLPYLLSQANFAPVTLEKVLTFINQECHEKTYSYWLIGFIRSFLEQRSLMDESQLKAWIEELYGLASENRYFFSLNRYIFHAQKP